MFLAFHAGHHEQIALPAGLALVLDARRPDGVRRLHMDEDTGVVGLGRDLQEAPFDSDDVIAEKVSKRKGVRTDTFSPACCAGKHFLWE
jgi:hypothetical protein